MYKNNGLLFNLMNRNVLSTLLKIEMVLDFRISKGIKFHSLGAWTARDLSFAILSSRAKHRLISTVTPSSDQSRYSESNLMCAFLTGLWKVVANPSVKSARLFCTLIFWRVYTGLSNAFSLFFASVFYCLLFCFCSCSLVFR